MFTPHQKRFITGTIIATGFWFIFFYCSSIIFSLTLAAILCTILIKEWTILFKHDSYKFWLLMPIYPILPFALLIYMNQHPQYHMLLYYLFLIVFTFDTSAYITGSLIGYHKIAPTISPNKTVEGCIGGFIGAFIAFYGALWENNSALSNATIVYLTAGICIIAFWGDIFESMLKRQAHIKHSGTILPGHGGFLDRFDAVMMVTFFFFVFRNNLTKILTAT